MADTFASFAAKLGKLEKELGDDSIGHAMGKEAKKIAEKAASADLGGDPQFSGWRPKLDTRYDIVRPGAIVLHGTRRSAGPWRVAEEGRNQQAGPRLADSTMTPTGRRRRGRRRRWNGQTVGKDTWSDAVSDMDRAIPKVVDKKVRTAIRNLF